MNKNISLVLSGGGARGIAHIGVIEVLEERGYQICEIVGTSMGSLVGGVYALGQMQAYKEWLCGLDRMKVFSLVDFTFGGGGFIKGDRVLGAMREFISDRPIEDLSIPYAAVAVDILNRKEVVFREGSIYDAIRASIAIPTVLTPVEVPGGLLIDGGVLNNLPLSHVEGGDNQPIVAVNVNANIPLEKPDLPRQESEDRESGYQEKIRQFYQQLFGTKAEEANSQAEKEKVEAETKKKEEELGFFGLISRTIDLMTDHITELALRRHQPDLLIDVSRHACGTFDFFKGEELVEIGRLAAEKQLEAWEKQA